MDKRWLLASAGIVALFASGPLSAQTWSLTPEQAAKMSSGQSAPATAASSGAKDETALIKDAAAALQSAEKLKSPSRN